MMGDKKSPQMVIHGSSSDNIGVRGEEGQDDLHVVCQELIEAVHSKSAAELASCLRAAFEFLGAELPEQEG